MAVIDLSNENVVHVKNGNTQYIQFRRLLEYSNKIRHCYTMIDNYELNNKENYQNICEKLGINYNKLTKIDKQIHSNFIEDVKNENEVHTNIDGLITKKSGISLALRYADCTPILLYDTQKNIIANIHSGWRGTTLKIGQKAVLKMIDEYSSNPNDIICCFGPCIGKCHFKVSQDVKDIFAQTFSYMDTNKIIQNGEVEDKEQKYYIDTTLINRLLLQEVGIRPENIIESKLCTVCNSDFFHSHRACKENSGRNTAIIGLV